MQTIKHHGNNTNIHPIMDELDKFFALTSERTIKQKRIVPFVFDQRFMELNELFTIYGGTDYDFRFTDREYQPLELSEYDEKNIILCFSGGKDSVAAALKYREMGYNVYLYHLKNVNPIFDEYRAVEELAAKLEMPLFIDEVTVSGHHEWIEHPMKNMIVANCALNYGVKNNITSQIAFGNYLTGSVEFDSFDYCGGDDIEMWHAYERIISAVIPEFHMNLCLDSVGVTLDTVCRNKDLLDSTISCLGRAGLRDYRRQWVKDKFDIELPKHRCGSCMKCAIEYIYMADHDLQKYSPEYYKYCLDRLQLNEKREFGVKVAHRDLWGAFFEYDIEKSKYLQSCKSVI